MRFWRSDPGGPLRVVGQNQETFRGLVEAADRSDERRSWWQQSLDRFASLFVVGGRDDAARLVGPEIAQRSRGDRVAGQLDVGLLHSHRRFGITLAGAVESNSA